MPDKTIAVNCECDILDKKETLCGKTPNTDYGDDDNINDCNEISTNSNVYSINTDIIHNVTSNYINVIPSNNEVINDGIESVVLTKGPTI